MRADHLSADLTKVTEIETLWSEVLQLYPDGIDILVNNAVWWSFSVNRPEICVILKSFSRCVTAATLIKWCNY